MGSTYYYEISILKIIISMKQLLIGMALTMAICCPSVTKAQKYEHLADTPAMLRSFQPHAFDEGWLFREDSTIDAFAADFNDTDWRTLSLPHDFAIERRFADDGMRPRQLIVGDSLHPFSLVLIQRNT